MPRTTTSGSTRTTRTLVVPASVRFTANESARAASHDPPAWAIAATTVNVTLATAIDRRALYRLAAARRRRPAEEKRSPGTRPSPLSSIDLGIPAPSSVEAARSSVKQDMIDGCVENDDVRNRRLRFDVAPEVSVVFSTERPTGTRSVSNAGQAAPASSEGRGAKPQGLTRSQRRASCPQRAFPRRHVAGDDSGGWGCRFRSSHITSEVQPAFNAEVGNVFAPTITKVSAMFICSPFVLLNDALAALAPHGTPALVTRRVSEEARPSYLANALGYLSAAPAPASRANLAHAAHVCGGGVRMQRSCRLSGRFAIDLRTRCRLGLQVRELAKSASDNRQA